MRSQSCCFGAPSFLRPNFRIMTWFPKASAESSNDEDYLPAILRNGRVYYMLQSKDKNIEVS